MKMNLELDHFFILTKPGAPVAERLIELGMTEGSSNQHPGQGTCNRRFFFPNGGMLELLWVHDTGEANTGPGRDLRFAERAANPDASPFGIILRRKDNLNTGLPFPGWTYQPDYFEPPMSFHIGENAKELAEPLCIYMSFVDPDKPYPGQETLDKETPNATGHFHTLTEIHVSTPNPTSCPVLDQVNNADKVYIHHGKPHLIKVIFDNQQQGQQCDLRPDLPLIVYW